MDQRCIELSSTAMAIQIHRETKMHQLQKFQSEKIRLAPNMQLSKGVPVRYKVILEQEISQLPLVLTRKEELDEALTLLTPTEN
jgi:hypothetical protein